MVELKGSLSAVGLPAIVQLIGELRHSGSLDLSKGTARGILEFDDGRLVAADFGGESGFKALAALSLELADAEFTFIEGVPKHERTLDLASKDVQAYLRRVASGDDLPLADPTPVAPNGSASLETCPLLGFADDRERHYSRATALHRCFASGAPSLVTGPEQRELCLGGRYPTCPRYRNASAASTAPIASVEDVPVATPPLLPPPAVRPPEPVPPSVRSPEPVPPRVRPAERVSPPAPIEIGPSPAPPLGVALPMAVANTVHVAEDDRPSRNGHDRSQQLPPEPRPDPPNRDIRLRRALLLIGCGVLIGLLLLAAIFVVSRPAADSGLATQKPSVAGAQVVAPLPSPTRVPAVATPPAVAPTGAPAANAATRPSTPTAVSKASSGPTAVPQPSGAVAGQTLLDERFAGGPGDGWVDNPPFAAWSAGAFRLQARQAAHFVAVGAPVDHTLSNVVVSGTFRKTGGPPGGGYGFLVRDQGPDPRDGVNQTMNAYVLEAGDLGEFGIWRREGDHWIDLVPWMRSTAVRPGGSPNDLVVRAVGNSLAFSINGTQVAALQEDTLPAGGVGVFIGGDNNEVALDRFTVQIPD